MANIINGTSLSSELKQKMADDIKVYAKTYSRIPHLAVIIIGDDPGSVSYVKGKEKACSLIGIKNTTIHLDDRVSQRTVLDLIDSLNNDDTVDGILIQLPLPKKFDETKVISRVRADKDVDGFHPSNVAGLWTKKPCILPCTPKGIMEILKSVNVDLKGKRVCVIGRSNIVGLPISKLLIDADATVTICHSKTKDITSITKEADILIVATGQAKMVTADYVKEGAIVIDVGVNRDPETNKLCGDVDFDSVEPKASYITKVPGGVGPMTICCLLENTIEAYLKHMNAKEEE
ncbi:MAG: bifunctional methylenetetrahydrofolate dehydrogenase/methenyltetrahydrofolate cyclohydrolase FolD [Anaeroplasmataceae bacterium]